MSFLDNLEDNLKSLEFAEGGRETADRQRRAREQELANAQAVAPWAEELKKSPFTEELLKQAARVGHSMRIKVYIAWLGTTLRLEACGRRLELRPTATGIVVVYLEHQQATRTESLDLSGNAAELVRGWLLNESEAADLGSK